MSVFLMDPVRCLHPRLRHMYGPVHECQECGLRGELVGWVEPIPGEKVCTKCDRLLSLSHFWAERGNRDGRKTACKDCLGRYQSEYRARRRLQQAR